MAFKNRKEQDGLTDPETVGVSHEPGGSYMDQVQVEVQQTGEGPGGESMALNSTGDAVNPEKSQQVNSIELDTDAANLLEPEGVDREPKQVKPAEVIYMPRKDFEARVNQTEFRFRSGVKTRVTRDVANMLLEDPDRGYVQE